MTDFTTHSKILIPEVSATRGYTYESSNNDNSEAGKNLCICESIDYSIYINVIQELLSIGVTKIIVPKNTGIEKLHPFLPPLLKDVTQVVDFTAQANQVDVLFNPIFEELKLEAIFPKAPVYGISIKTKNKPSKDLIFIISVCSSLRLQLFNYLMGMEHNLAIEFELKRAKESITFLINELNGIATTSTLSYLLGVFNSYQKTNIDSVGLTSSASNEFVNLFDTLLRQEDYQKMAQHASRLGFPETVSNSIASLTKSSLNLIKKEGFKNVLDYVSKVFELAFFIPKPGNVFFDKLLGQRYLPPLIPLETVRDEAQKNG